MLISVIIPSRDRPELLSEAVTSVLAQDYPKVEIVVVDDGSQKPLSLEQLNLPPGSNTDNIRLVNLPGQRRGRGPAYARNVGVWASTGHYCAFLDDDDIWIAPDYLSSAMGAVAACESSVELHLSNQEAYSSKTGDSKKLWLYPLVEVLAQSSAGWSDDSTPVNVDQLMSIGGFCHLNTTIVSRELFDRIGGLDESLRYEEDLDFYLRAIDQAGHIVFSRRIVAQHRIPDSTQARNASTAVDYFNKMNIRLYLLNKNYLSASHPAIRTFCRQYIASSTKLMTEKFLEEGNVELARQFGLRALGVQYSFKWFGYCVYLSLRSFFTGKVG